MDNPVAGEAAPRPVRCSGRSGESMLWAALFIAVLFLGGAQLVLIGVLGEYVGRIYGEAKRRPLYVVKERLGFPSPAAQSDAPQGAESERRRGRAGRLAD